MHLQPVTLQSEYEYQQVEKSPGVEQHGSNCGHPRDLVTCIYLISAAAQVRWMMQSSTWVGGPRAIVAALIPHEQSVVHLTLQSLSS